MITLAIETSCDETAICILETRPAAKNNQPTPEYRILANLVHSQIAIHKQYGGVFPIMAKREHARIIVPLLETALKEAKIKMVQIDDACDTNDANNTDNDEKIKAVQTILQEKESDLLKHLLASILIKEKPVIDRIAVTYGPGLEPALWVGVNAAKALGILWNIPVVGVNHMEGHILGSLLPSSVATSDFKKLAVITYPALTLLISGGHTELVVVKEVKKKYVYEIVGRTKDDAVGEAFDKVARLLGLLYPGGPEISRLAEAERKEHKRSGNGHTNEHIDEHIKERPIILPRPMIHSPDLNFSFSGLKTSVLYLTRELQKENKIAYNTEELTDRQKSQIAREFEDAVTDVLIHKTEKAIDHYGIASLLIGGGVIANSHIVQALTQLAARYDIPIYIPPDGVSGDNALMIALAGAFAEVSATADSANLRADGNLSLGV